MAFQGNALQHNAFQTGIPSAGADPVFPGTRVTPQQDVSRWQEVAGYALLFTSALMPNANTVAASEYQVGTHQAAIAASQDRSWVRGTPFTLIPSAAGDVILRPTKVVAPEQVDGSYALTFSAPLTYAAVVAPPPATFTAAPEQIDGAYALHWSPPLSYLSRVGPTGTTLHAGEQVDPSPFLPPSWVHGTPDTLFPVVVGDTLPPRTWIAAPEQVDGAYALTFNLPLTYVAVVTAPPVTITVDPQQVDGAYALTWHQQPPDPVQAPFPTGTITVEPQAFDAAYALTWRIPVQYQANVRLTAETLVSLAEPFDTYIAAQTFGTAPASVGPGSDVRIAGTILTHAQHDPDRPSWVLLISETLIPPPVIPPVTPPATGPAPFVGDRQEGRHVDPLHQDDDEIALIVTAFMSIKGSRHWPR